MSPRRVASASLACALLTPAAARASNVTELPDNGSEQMGRGGAWVARASDPLATFYNPAGLAGQPSRVTLQANLVFHDTCFARVKAAGDTTFGASDPLLGPDGRYPRTCTEGGPSVAPQVGVTWRVNDRLGIGLLFVTPSAAGARTWPDFTSDAQGTPQASPNRYLLLRQSGVIAFPTLGVGYEVASSLRVGASVSWGFARLKLTSAVQAVNTDAANAANDVRANVQVKDDFVPGLTLGTLWSPLRELDVAGFFRWSDAVRARGDAGTAANWFTARNARGDASGVRHADTVFEDCGTGLPTAACGAGGNARVVLRVPMEAKIGARWHKPRVTLPRWYGGDVAGTYPRPSPSAARPRDPLHDDVFDLEADLTWANDSAIDAVEIRFPGDASGRGLLPSAVQGGELPPNADQPRRFRDVVGVRIGGDVNVLPDRLALRAGAFFESSAANPTTQSLDVAAASRVGVALGATYRLRLARAEDAPAVELSLGYGHVFVAEQNRSDPNASGLPALAGTSCNGSTPSGPNVCSDGSQRYRTRWPVNLGTITNAASLVNLGLAYRF
jgi:long-chain fatty acid transport protein